jgi:hypothetical protein
LARPTKYLTDTARSTARRRQWHAAQVRCREALASESKRYRLEALNLLTTADPALRPFVAMVIWRDAANGCKPAQAALSDPTVAQHIGRMLVRAWTREIIGWAAQLPVPKSLAESTTPEIRRVAHLVDTT